MKKWKPICGETFYYITQSGTVGTTRAGRGRDTIFKIASGNCFKTPTQAAKVLKSILDKLRLPYFTWGKLELPEFPAERFANVPIEFIPELKP